MRDALGGVINIQMILVFIAIVSGYLAFSVNYTKAFHVKNYIVNKIEEYEGHFERQDVMTSINRYMDKVGYSGPPSGSSPSIDCSGKDGLPSGTPVTGLSNKYALCKYTGQPKIEKVNGKDVSVDRYYYKVVTYVSIDVPVINQIMAGLDFFQISGETKLISDVG